MSNELLMSVSAVRPLEDVVHDTLHVPLKIANSPHYELCQTSAWSFLFLIKQRG